MVTRFSAKLIVINGPTQTHKDENVTILANELSREPAALFVRRVEAR